MKCTLCLSSQANLTYSIPSPIIGDATIVANQSHSFFDALVIAEVSMIGYLHGHHFSGSGTNLSPTPIRHVCFAEQVEIECEVSPLLSAIAKQSWPTDISMNIYKMSQPTTNSRTTTVTGIQRLMGGIHAHAFLTYYENSKSKIKDRFGDKPEKWPDTLKFARITRNAFGHRGQLEIRNPNDSSAWRGLTLNYKNNGETMLYNHITAGDIILLMLDIDDLY